MPLTGILSPPYTAVFRSPAGPPVLGSIVVIDMAEAEVALTSAILLKSQAPWCPLAVLGHSSPLSARAIELLTQLHGPLGFVDYPVRPAAGFLGDILTAVRNRPVPDTESLATYVATRLGEPKLANVLAKTRAPGAGRQDGYRVPADRGVSRRLHAAGPLGVKDWSWTFRLARLAGRKDLSVEELARRHGAETRTFRAHVRRYTGESVQTFRERVGWEWVVEAALREWGYLDTAVVATGDSTARWA